MHFFLGALRVNSVYTDENIGRYGNFVGLLGSFVEILYYFVDLF